MRNGGIRKRRQIQAAPMLAVRSLAAQLRRAEPNRRDTETAPYSKKTEVVEFKAISPEGSLKIGGDIAMQRQPFFVD